MPECRCQNDAARRTDGKTDDAGLTFFPAFRYSGIPLFGHSGIPAFLYSGILACLFFNTVKNGLGAYFHIDKSSVADPNYFYLNSDTDPQFFFLFGLKYGFYRGVYFLQKPVQRFVLITYKHFMYAVYSEKSFATVKKLNLLFVFSTTVLKYNIASHMPR
jgi:hypothetical protein